MIAKAKTLGLRAANSSAIRAAAGRIRDYVEGHQPTATAPTTNPAADLAGYYQAGPDGHSPGRARGAGAAAIGLQGTVGGAQLTAALCGQHAVTGATLIGPKGSTGRVAGPPTGSRRVAATGNPEDWLSLAQASYLTGLEPSTLRRLAEHQPQATFPNATDASELDPRVARRLVEVLARRLITPPATQYLLAAKDATSGEWRVRRGEVGRFIADRTTAETVMGFDVVCSAPKSVSLLWAVGDERLRADIAASFDAAVDATLGYLERHGAFGKVDGHNLPADGLAAVSYVHDTSRADEAHLHTHNVIINAVRVVVRDDTGRPAFDADGNPRVVWRTLDSGALLAHMHAAGHIGAAELRHQLAARWGIEWGTVRSGVAEITGFPPELLAAFSTRHDQVTAEFASLVESGATPDGTTEDAAQRGTRAPKRVLADDTVRAIQIGRLASIGWTAEQVCALAGGRPRHLGVTAADIAALHDHLAGPAGLTERRTTFTARDVHEAVAAWAVDRLPANQVRAIAEAFLADRRVVSCVLGERGRRRQDPEPTFTTENLLAVEDNLHTLYRQGRVDHGAIPTVPVVETLVTGALASTPQLSPEQRDLVRAVVDCGDRIRCLIGPAGTGKTEAMRAAVAAWQAAGWNVIGAANGGTQAEQLAERLDVPTEVVASWVTRLSTAGDPSTVWPSGTVLIVDEATQVSTRDAEPMARWAYRTGTTLVFVGDPAQLGSVGAGGWFRRIVYSHGAPSLSTIYRQRGDEMEEVRRALSGLRSEVPERVRRAMDRLGADGRIRIFDNAEQLLDSTVDDWYADRHARLGATGHQPKPSRMMAARHRDVDALNRLARARLRADGTLSGDELDVRGRRFAVGDEVITLTQAGHTLVPAGAPRHAYIRTGTVGVITAINHTGRAPSVEVSFGAKGRVAVDWAYLTHDFADGRTGGLTHAYAITADRAQGSTMHAARAVATDTTSRPALYVMLSRGEADIAGYLIRERDLQTRLDDESWLPVLRHPGGPLDAVIGHLEQSRAERLAGDLDPIAWEAHQLRRSSDLASLSGLRGSASGRDLLIARRAELAEEAAIAAAAIDRPHPVLVGRLGPRPASGAAQRSWDRAVGAVACYHARWNPQAGVDGHWALGPRPTAARSSWDAQRAEASAVVARWAAALPPAQAKRFWAVIEHIPRERAAASIHALLAAGHTPDDILESLTRREQETAHTGAAILDYRVRKLCEHNDVDPTVFMLAPPLTQAAEWQHVAGLLDTAEIEQLALQLTPALAAERRAITGPGMPDVARDRHRLLTAALDLQVDIAVEQFAAQPASYLAAVLGARPTAPELAAEWDRRGRAVEVWRHHQLGLPYGRPAATNDGTAVEQALGAEPVDPALVMQRRALLDHTATTLELERAT